jgi:N-acyl-D-amino-acid deacylase
MLDLLIKNACYPDFDTNTFKYGDIGIENGVISMIGDINEDHICHIDATGLCVSPGFIDIHMHEEKLRMTSKDPFDIANYMLNMGVTTAVSGNCGNNRQTIDRFFTYIDRYGSPVNYLSFIGHNYLRDFAGIKDRYRAATSQEIILMRREMMRNIQLGAIGLSFGLEYSPGTNIEEINGLLSYTSGKEIMLSAHYRYDGAQSIDAINELIQISDNFKLPMQISHLVSCSAMGHMTKSLELIAANIDRGVDIGVDSYPYDAFCTRIGSAAFDENCFERWNKSYENILLLEHPYSQEKCTKETFHYVRKNYPDMLVAAFVMNEEESIQAILDPNVIIASDGLYNNAKGHPRGAGTFPKVLSRKYRDQTGLDLIAALEKMTRMPARRMRLNKKGVIAVGYDADIAIFDPETIQDTADYASPTTPPIGMQYVIIDGQIAISSKVHMNTRLGKVIRRNQLNLWRDNLVR